MTTIKFAKIFSGDATLLECEKITKSPKKKAAGYPHSSPRVVVISKE